MNPIPPRTLFRLAALAAALAMLHPATARAGRVGEALLTRLADDVMQAPSDDQGGDPGPDFTLPENFRPWWQPLVVEGLDRSARPVGLKLDGLIQSSLHHSYRVRVYADSLLSEETSIAEARAAFDWRAFMETYYDDLSEPVGNTLTTGGAPRFRDHDWSGSAGMKRKNPIGGQFEASQQIGYRDNNSVFFQPTQQGNARLSLSYTQPLLRGLGRAYNTRWIVLAQLDSAAASDQFARQLQDYLLDVTEAYWDLHLRRAVLLQRRRSYDQARAIYDELYARRDMDVAASQLAQATSALARRQSEVSTAEMDVRNAEAKVRNLVNDPALAAGQTELLPWDLPFEGRIPLEPKALKLSALAHRPEIKEVLNQIEAAKVRLHVADHELLPALDFVLETYASGLEGHSDVGTALGEQFSKGEPSYSIGLTLEVPLGNHEAKARLQRRQLELRRLMSQLRATAENVLYEVEVAARQVNTYHRNMISNYHAMTSATAEIAYFRERWEALPGDDQVASIFLDRLLDTQDELANAEAAFESALVSYNVALFNVRRAEGTLLDFQGVSMGRACVGGMPSLMLDSPAPAPTAADPEPMAPPRPASPELDGPNAGPAGALRRLPGGTIAGEDTLVLPPGVIVPLPEVRRAPVRLPRGTGPSRGPQLQRVPASG